MASSESHYTLLYTCALALSIPCHPSSADSGTTIPIFKLCPQCDPHPHLLPTIFDQEHFDDVQAANASAAALANSTQPSSGNSSAASSLLLVPERDRSPACSLVSLRSKSSTCSKVSTGFSKLRQLVSGPCRKSAQEAKPYREGEEAAPYMTSWLERTLERRARENEAELAKTAEERKDEAKEKEIGRKLDEVERKVKLEKAMRIEQSLRVLV